jgi:hypothetical protein
MGGEIIVTDFMGGEIIVTDFMGGEIINFKLKLFS